MAGKKQTPRKRAVAAGGAEGAETRRGGRAGRLTVRRGTAAYRAATQERASQVRESIEAALAKGRRTREEIEARIESQWKERRPSAAKKAPRRRTRAKR